MNIDFMYKAMELADKSLLINDIPVGAIVVANDVVIGEGFNNRTVSNNTIGHAEINAILSANKYVSDWRLSNADIYVTMFPCNMCIEVIKEARIKNVYYLLSSKNNRDKEINKIDNISFVKVNVDSNSYEKFDEKFRNFFVNLR